MNSEKKEVAISFLEQHQTPGIDSLINGITEGKIDITRAIKEIRNETADGIKLLEITLDVMNNPED